MHDFPLGLITVILCAAGYFFSWRFWVKDNYKIAVFLLLVCGFALRLFASGDAYLHEWDEKYHAVVAKNMIEHPLTPVLYKDPALPYDYKDWAANHIWVHKQPLPLWTMSASMALFGINELALRIPSIILTTIGIWLTFFIGSFFFNKKVGFIAAFLFSANGRLIEQTAGRVATDHIDVFFLFFIALAIYFGIKFVQKEKSIYNVAVGICIGAAVLSKWLPALIVFPVWILIVIDSGKFKPRQIVFQLFLIAITCIVIFLPWQLYIYSAFPLEANWEAAYNLRHITEELGGQKSTVFSFTEWIHTNYGDLIYLPLAWFTFKIVKDRYDFKRLAIFAWFLIPFLFFSFAKTRMQGYLVFVSPALFLMTADFWMMLSVYKINHKFKWIFNVLMILLIVLPLRYAIERVKPMENRRRESAWITELKNLNERKIKKGILLNYDRPIDAMFYTNMVAYTWIPEKKVILDLMDKGYTIIIKNDGNVSDSIRMIKGVSIEKFSSTEK